MKPWRVDKHIDTSCPGSPQPSASRQRTPERVTIPGFATRLTGQSGPSGRAARPSAATKAPERLPALNYSILKDNALKKKMSELNISTSGSRQLLEQRHKEWVTIWNANCDSARPKSRLELLHDLDIWERTLGIRAPTTTSSHRGNQIRDKDFDAAAWAAKHDNSFKDLIALARRTRSQANQQPQENGTTPGTSDETPDEELTIIPNSPEQHVVGEAGKRSPIDLTQSPSRPTEIPAPNAPGKTGPGEDALAHASNPASAEPTDSPRPSASEPRTLCTGRGFPANSAGYNKEGLP